MVFLNDSIPFLISRTLSSQLHGGFPLTSCRSTHCNASSHAPWDICKYTHTYITSETHIQLQRKLEIHKYKCQWKNSCRTWIPNKHQNHCSGRTLKEEIVIFLLISSLCLKYIISLVLGLQLKDWKLLLQELSAFKFSPEDAFAQNHNLPLKL